MKKNCPQCNKEFEKNPHSSKKQWILKKFCSRECFHISEKGKIISNETKEKNKIATLKRFNSGEKFGFQKGIDTWNKNTKGICKPNSGSFKKGQVGWNKNTKGLTKANKTSFKKGNKPITPFYKGMTAWNKNKPAPWVKPPVMKGKNHPNYKGGITPENHKIRTSLEIKLWRKACLERDNFADQKTGIQGGNLVVHHINNFVDFKELRTSIENGITLSQESHRAFHKKYGYRNNTREQLLEYLNTK